MFYRALESWRGLAALAVAMFHFAGTFQPADFGPFVRHSYLFVDFFFVLSGLVIAANYSERLKLPDESWRFVIRRFGRLWPLHVATMLAVVVWQSRKGNLPPLSLVTEEGLHPILANLLLLQVMGANNALTLNYPSWSISAEFWTCILFLALIRFGGRRAPAIAAVLIAAGAAIAFAHTGPYMEATWDIGLPRAAYGFFTGYLLFLLLERLGERAPGGTLLEIATLALAVGFVIAGGSNGSRVAPLATLLFAPVVFVFAREQGVLSALLALPLFRFLGRISYSTYMVHAPVLMFFTSGLNVLAAQTGSGWTYKEFAAVAAAGNWVPLLLVTAAFLAAVILTATLTFHLIEQPGRRFFNRLASRRDAAAAAATP